MSDLVVARVFDKRYQAELAQGLLSEQGIESIISADDCGGQLMGMSSLRMGGVKLLVTMEDLPEAQELLEVLGND
jgi:hypothetical protein